MHHRPFVLKDMGSLAFGGTVSTNEDGVTFHGDHGYAQYFIPEHATEYPVIFWHGLGQSGRCWESTPDGRDGFWQLFLQDDIPVYIIDQCRRGRAGYTLSDVDTDALLPVEKSEAAVWGTYRIGTWNAPSESAKIFSDSQFVATPYAIDQFFRMQSPNSGTEPSTNEHNAFMAQNMRDLLEQAGESILFTHSHSGKYGWETALAAPKFVRGILSYEPGQCLFPEDYQLDYVDSPLGSIINDVMAQYTAPRERWLNLTKMPIRIFYGDHIKHEPSDDFGDEIWRISVYRSQQFVNLINENGGDAKLISLPDEGLHGNGHSAFIEANNEEFAALVKKELLDSGLLGRENPYDGIHRKTLSKTTIPLE